MSVDSHPGPEPLVEAWRALGRHIAVAAGAAAALLSLFGDTPLRIACLRGALAWGSILTLTSAGAWLASRTWTAPPTAPESSGDLDEPQGPAAGRRQDAA